MTQQPPVAPRCYRHPDTETWIRCARCMKPICPLCMTSAAVGFQCPDCVGIGQQTQRKPVTPAGAPLGEKPTVVYALIALNAVIFLLTWATGTDAAWAKWAMVPQAVADGEWYRLITAAFIHQGFLHIAFNMYILYIVGSPLERMAGHLRFIVMYLVAALGGTIASYAFNDAFTASAGASGAIFGLMGAFAVAAIRFKYDARQILFLVGLNLVLGFVLTGVDWKAHIGGLITGAAVSFVFFYAPRARRTVVQVLGVLGILVVLLGIVLWRTSELSSGMLF